MPHSLLAYYRTLKHSHLADWQRPETFLPWLHIFLRCLHCIDNKVTLCFYIRISTNAFLHTQQSSSQMFLNYHINYTLVIILLYSIGLFKIPFFFYY